MESVLGAFRDMNTNKDVKIRELQAKVKALEQVGKSTTEHQIRYELDKLELIDYFGGEVFRDPNAHNVATDFRTAARSILVEENSEERVGAFCGLFITVTVEYEKLPFKSPSKRYWTKSVKVRVK